MRRESAAYDHRLVSKSSWANLLTARACAEASEVKVCFVSTTASSWGMHREVERETPRALLDHSGAASEHVPPSSGGENWFGEGFWAAAVLAVGVSAAGFAIAFRSSLAFALESAAGTSSVVSAMREAPVWVRVVSPALGGLLAGALGLLVRRSPGGQGVGAVMEAVVLGRVGLSLPATLLRSAASWVAIATGGSLGREGPLIQFGGAAGRFIGEKMSMSRRRARILIAAGTAAGFAAAYNTPFAAVLFVLEVVLGIVALEAIIPVLAATALATTLTRAVVGEGPIYGQRAFQIESANELFAFAALGICAALGAQAFMRVLSLGEKLFRASRVPLPWRPAIGGALAGAVIAFLPDVAGNGYEPLNSLLDGTLAIPFVAVLLLGKVVATTASVGSGSPGGVFTPTLLIGGALGGLFAHFIRLLGFETGPVGGYELVGMAAATAATTHAPLMAAVMVFELSGDYAIVLPLVLATAVATQISRALRPDSIYAAELKERGLGWELTIEGRRLVGQDRPPQDHGSDEKP